MLQLKIEPCKTVEADLLSEFLEATGALSVTFTDKYDDPILEPDIGTMPLWQTVVLQALYIEQEPLDAAIKHIQDNYPHLVCGVETLPETDWQRVALADLQPQQFGKRLWVCPSWLTPPQPDAINLILDPGLAFGTGTHPTTHLCLLWLEQHNLAFQHIIDYGCGSGILALAALELGAEHAHGVDIDEQALQASEQNAIINQITASQLTVSSTDDAIEPADILIANILLAPILSLKSRFETLLKPAGKLVLSGLLEEQLPQVREAYQDTFEYESSLTLDGWGLIEFSLR